jgi:hypothetical protein
MFKIFFKGEAVPSEILTFHRRNENCILPGKVRVSKDCACNRKHGEYHVRPLIGVSKVNSIYIDELGGCIVKGGGNGIVITTNQYSTHSHYQ